MPFAPFLTLSPLRRARLLAGHTLVELHRASAVSVTRLSLAERRLVELTKAEQRAVARALGCDGNWLFAPEDDVPSVSR